MSSYLLMPPKYLAGQNVRAKCSATRWDAAKIIMVATYYTHEHVGYHVYTVSFPGRSRHRHLGEDEVAHV